MKTNHVKNFGFAFLFTWVISLVLAVTVYAASKNYYGLTTVYYFTHLTQPIERD